MNILIVLIEAIGLTVLSKLEAEQAESEHERERFHEQIKSLERQLEDSKQLYARARDFADEMSYTLFSEEDIGPPTDEDRWKKALELLKYQQDEY